MIRARRTAWLAGLVIAAAAGASHARVTRMALGQTKTVRGTVEVVIEERLDGGEVRHVSIRTEHGAVPIDPDKAVAGEPRQENQESMDAAAVQADEAR